MVGGGGGLDGAGAGHVAHGAVAHGAGDDLLAVAQPVDAAGRQPHPVTQEDLALVGVVEAGQGDVLALDVAPHVQLGPVAQGEDPHVLTGAVAGVEQVPQLGALVARVPLAELVAQGDDALLGPGLLLVAAPAAEDAVEAALLDGVEKRDGLERVTGAVGALAQTAVVDVVLDAGHHEPQTELLDRPVAVGQQLGEVVAGVHVQDGEGDRSGPEGLARQVQHDHGVLAPGEQQHGAAALGGDLPDDEDGLGLQDVKDVQGLTGGGGLGEVGQAGRFELRRLMGDGGGGWGRTGVGQGDAHRWIPHSVLVNPAQRPERGSSPGLTRAVHGAQPIEG